MSYIYKDLYLLKIAFFNYLSVWGVNKELHRCRKVQDAILYYKDEAEQLVKDLRHLNLNVQVVEVEKERRALRHFINTSEYKNLLTTKRSKNKLQTV